MRSVSESAPTVEACNSRLDPTVISAFERDAKIGLLATTTAEGLPHVTLITSMQAKSPTRLMFGQFCEGLSKTQAAEHPQTGFLVLDADRRWWRGKALWQAKATQGEDYEAYNRKPMFRYNAYFGIHTVHYLDVVEIDPVRRLATPPLVAWTLATRLAAVASPRDRQALALTPWARRLIQQTSTLKFLCYVGPDGYPMLLPAVACAPVGSSRLLFAPTVAREELAELTRERPLALFALNLQMQSVLVRGPFVGWRRLSRRTMGMLVADWVYNSMPPKHGQIYPPTPLSPVTSFA